MTSKAESAFCSFRRWVFGQASVVKVECCGFAGLGFRDRRRFHEGHAWFAEHGGKGISIEDVLAEFG